MLKTHPKRRQLKNGPEKRSLLYKKRKNAQSQKGNKKKFNFPHSPK